MCSLENQSLSLTATVMSQYNYDAMASCTVDFRMAVQIENDISQVVSGRWLGITANSVYVYCTKLPRWLMNLVHNFHLHITTSRHLPLYPLDNHDSQTTHV